MFTVTYTANNGSTFVLSETENADQDGFWHIVTRFGEFGLETEFTEFSHQWGSPLRSWVLRHHASRWPAAVHLHACHEHVLATHQALFRVRPMHYLAHVARSVLHQLQIKYVSLPLARFL